VLQSIAVPPSYSFWPSQPLSPPVFASPSYPSPICHHTTPPSYTLTTHWLAYCMNHTHRHHPAITDTSTLHYNSRKLPKHTHKGQKTQQLLYLFFTHSYLSAPLLVPHLQITQVSISNQAIIIP
jgi:hypothetical protein